MPCQVFLCGLPNLKLQFLHPDHAFGVCIHFQLARTPFFPFLLNDQLRSIQFFSRNLKILMLCTNV